MQKIINVLAIASGVVSLAVVGSVGYVFVNKDAIIDSVKEKAMEAVMGGLGVPSIPTGASDLPAIGATPSIGSGADPAPGPPAPPTAALPGF